MLPNKIIVKVSTSFPWWPIERQTPNGDGVWGEFQFIFNQEVQECDYWLVLDGLSSIEKSICNSLNTFFVTSEPPGIKHYSKQFLSQFASVVTCHTNLKHKNQVHYQQALPWMFGAHYDASSKSWRDFYSFKQIESFSFVKTKCMSVVAARKSVVPGHEKRHLFLEALKRRLGDKLDIFGHGYLAIPDKLDAIAPYKYHLVIENSYIDDYWTEKLADAYLGEAFPIYYGCPNIRNYFSDASMLMVDIEDIDDAINKIEKLIQDDPYEQHRGEVVKAKHDIMYRYNIFAEFERLALSNLVSGNKARRKKKLIELRPDSNQNDSFMLGAFFSTLLKPLKHLGLHRLWIRLSRFIGKS